MQHATAKIESSDALHAARRGNQGAAFADPTPDRKTVTTPMPAPRSAGLRSPCACGGGCPRCGSGGQGAAQGAPVPAPLRTKAEATLGVGLSDVRLAERGPLADHVARRGADAGTRGNVIAFPRGAPDLAQPGGRFALGHELAHVAQQRRGPTGGIGAASAVKEHSADMAAEAISGGGQGQVGRSGDLEAETHGGGPLQFGIFDAIGGAARQVNDAVAPVLDPLAQVAHGVIADTMMTMLDVPALAMSFITNLPQRVLRLFADAVQGQDGMALWLREFAGLFLNWQGWSAVWGHLVQGVFDGAAWVGELFMHALEVVGVGEFLQFVWARANIMAPLNSAQIGAAQEVHPPGLIPYPQVRVDYNSLVARLAALSSPNRSGSVADQIFGTAAASHRAVTTMHVIHTGHTMEEPLAVHELTHVAQYELVGAMYMPEAIHAQEFGQGYDYQLLHGSLGASIAAGATYADFNREQQAMICEDNYRLRHGLAAARGGSASDLEYFLNDYWGRAGIPFVRWFADQ